MNHRLKVLVLILLATLVSVVSCTRQSQVVGEIESTRLAGSNQERVDISVVLRKHYPVGMPISALREKFTADGFSFHEYEIPINKKKHPTERSFYGVVYIWENWRRYACNYGLRTQNGKLKSIAGSALDVTFPAL